MKVKEIFQSFENLNVIIVGDLMLDRYITGRVSRISPEAPVPVVAWGNEENRLGGAANVALNVKALGAVPFLCGLAGKDADGYRLLELLPANGLDNQGVVLSTERMTTVKTRIIAGNQHLIRLDKEQMNDLSPGEERHLLSSVMDLLQSRTFHVMILQDYNKGVLSKNVISRLLEEARQRKIPVAVDPKNRNFWEYKGVDLFKPNLKEVGDALSSGLTATPESLRMASNTIRQQLRNRYTLITLSDKGVYLDDEQGWQSYPTHPRNVADVCGAGDTVVSIAALAMALGLDKDTMALLANLAGGQVVEKVGVVPVDKDQLQWEVRQVLKTTKSIY